MINTYEYAFKESRNQGNNMRAIVSKEKQDQITYLI